VAVVILHIHIYKKKVTTKFKSGRLHELACSRNLGNWELSEHSLVDGNQEKPVSRWPVIGPSGH